MLAITREVSPSVANCELTHLARAPIDYATAVAQHHDYIETLRRLGCTVETIAGDADYPDCVFIEDTAIVVDELATITRPGAESRRGERAAVAEALRKHRPLSSIEAPGTIDGGDVLCIGRHFYIGVSERTNAEGIAQFQALVAPFDYRVTSVAMHDCLHLKTAVTQVGPELVLANRSWFDATALDRGTTIIDVDASEPFAANALLVGGSVVYPRAFPRTAQRLRERGIDLHLVDASELAKAEGGVTCCSLLLRAE